MYYSQEHGVPVKSVMYGPDGKPITTMTFSDYKFDVKIDPQRFVFKAPEGVQVIDQTAQQP
jgi:outer membrane lipoprotein-sorting protein